MRFRHADGTVVHLAYRTNVHLAEDLEGVFRQPARHGLEVVTLNGFPYGGFQREVGARPCW